MRMNFKIILAVVFLLELVPTATFAAPYRLRSSDVRVMMQLHSVLSEQVHEKLRKDSAIYRLQGY